MSDLTLARTATETVMGMQVYEQAIDERAEVALALADPDAQLHRALVRSMRAPLRGNRRIPMSAVRVAGPQLRREVGRWLYPGHGPVHRLDLTLPPSPRGDIVTVHDIAPLRFPDEGKLPPSAHKELARAAAVITVSAFSAEEIVRHLGTPDPIVIPNGVDHQRFADARPLPESELRGLGVTGPYVLAAGGASLRKNLDGMARAWRLVRSSRPGLTLVLSGPPHPRRDRLFRSLPGVVRVGRVDDDMLPRLLAGCSTLVIPSLYEGFGLPAIEGMAAGVPVVAMDASSLPEVLGGSGILADGSPQSLAEAILWSAGNDAEVRSRVAAGRARSLQFTWERSAAMHARVWADVIAGRTPRVV
ncbi:glycosyltransferase family 4 protein [Janibacter sp. GS2]|uniref:glycosyltransferase family 4 protein n=1 Tax=Janibacter sp. GS2 TaxID=3442646 RepID=UPI003EBF3198